MVEARPKQKQSPRLQTLLKLLKSLLFFTLKLFRKLPTGYHFNLNIEKIKNAIIIPLQGNNYIAITYKKQNLNHLPSKFVSLLNRT